MEALSTGLVPVWVPVKIILRKDDPLADTLGPGVEWRNTPDVPDGIRWRHAAIPVQIEGGHPNHGKPLTSACRVFVAEADVSKVTTAVTPTHRDRALIAMGLAGPDAVKVRAFVEELKADFAGTGALSAGDKAALQEAVVEAVRRGLRLTDAEGIIEEHGLAD